MTDVGRLVKNFFSVTSMRVVTSIFSFLFFSLLARKWGAESLGEFSTLFTVFMFLIQMPLLGLNIVISRDVGASPETTPEMFTNGLVISLTVSIFLVFIVGLFGVLLYPPHLHASFWLVGGATVFMAVTCVAEAIFIGHERMQIIAWANIGENILRVALGVVLVLMGYGLTAVMFLFVLARLLAVVIYFKTGELSKHLSGEYFSWSTVQTFVKKIPTFFGILLLGVIVGRVDFIALSLMVPMKEVGMYSAPFKIYEIGLMVPTMLTVVVFPTFSRFFKSDRPAFDRFYLNCLGITIAVGLPLVLLLAYASGFMIEVIFGTQYLEGSAALHLLSIAILFVALDQILTAVTLAAHREDLEFRILVVAFIVYSVLLLVLIPMFSFMGAAISTTAATFAKFVVRYVWIRRAVGIPSGIHLSFKPLIATLPMMGLLWILMDVNIFLTSFLGLVVYIGALFAIKGVTPGQLVNFKEAMARGRG